MTPVGFEPTPFRNGALSHRFRPLGQSVVVHMQGVAQSRTWLILWHIEVHARTLSLPVMPKRQLGGLRGRDSFRAAYGFPVCVGCLGCLGPWLMQNWKCCKAVFLGCEQMGTSWNTFAPNPQNAHAGSRTRVTSMGGLYDTATLHALMQ